MKLNCELIYVLCPEVHPVIEVATQLADGLGDLWPMATEVLVRQPVLSRPSPHAAEHFLMDALEGRVGKKPRADDTAALGPNKGVHDVRLLGAVQRLLGAY